MSELNENDWLAFLNANFKVEGYDSDGVLRLDEIHTTKSAVQSFGFADLVIAWEAYKNGSCKMINSDGTLNAVFTLIKGN